MANFYFIALSDQTEQSKAGEITAELEAAGALRLWANTWVLETELNSYDLRQTIPTFHYGDAGFIVPFTDNGFAYTGEGTPGKDALARHLMAAGMAMVRRGLAGQR